MIVPVTSDKYHNLFTDAELFLKLDKGTISDLNAYYGYMKEFYDAAKEDPKGYKFIMMPLNEEVFEISLDTRSINVPASFKKIAGGKVGGVQADQMAELIIFECDRYFDYMDLANTEIYVQWQLPNLDKTVGATYITMKDLTTPGKIRFAWPLYDVITKHSGNVKFSVRFYLMTKEELPEGGTQDKMSYALNTLEAELPIKPALNPTLNVIPEVVGGLFEKSIINSSWVTAGRIPPLLPSFENPGSNMTIVDKNNCYVRSMTVNETTSPRKVQVAKLHNDTLSLRAQAIAGDSGTITYVWKLATDEERFEDGSFRWRELKDENGNPIGKIEPVYEKALLSYNNKGERVLNNLDRYFKVATWKDIPKLNEKGEQEKDVNGEPITEQIPDTYDEYTGSEVPDFELYEKYIQYTVPTTSQNIVGYYAVAAINTIGDLSSSESWSSLCYLPGPANISFVEQNIFSEKKNPNTDNPYLEVNTVNDINSPDMTYTWYYGSSDENAVIQSAENDAAKENVEKMSGFERESLKPGWYAAHVKAKLNRKEKKAHTTTAYTVYAPASIESVKPDLGEKQDTSITLDVGQTADLKVITTVNTPKGFDEGKISECLYKNLTYKWEYAAVDKNEWTEIKEDDIGESNPSKLVVKMDGNVLTVRKPKNETVAVRKYRCIVTNSLGLKNSCSAESDTFYII